MKISKLFHWLYGLIMLLPIFAIGTTCLISTFNMSSKEESEIHYKYETNEVNSASDLVVGRAYHFSLNDNTTDELFAHDIILNFYNIDFINLSRYQPEFTDFQGNNTNLNYVFNVYLSGSLCQLYLPSDDDTNYIFEFDFHGDEENWSLIGDCIIFHNNLNQDDAGINLFSKCENIPIDYVETHNIETQDVFYNAVNKVTTHPLFSWSYNSFLAEPFVYICNLFSLPTNSVIVELLSYWLAISIIWLIFDVIMYVPLLVHRWLDKGVVE